MLRLAPDTVPASSPDVAGRASMPAGGRAQKNASPSSPAARSRCSTPASTRRRFRCSPASASRSWCRGARAAAARWSTIWAARNRRWPRRGKHRRLDAPDRAGGLDAIIITASGCGTTIKDYGFMLRLDPAYAEKAARVSALAKTSGIPGDARPAAAGAKVRPYRRLPFGLLDAARPEDHPPAEGASPEGRLHR